jgi:hypothetical protein
VSIFALPAYIELILSLAMLVLQAFAFVDGVAQRPDAYRAADKLTKNAWMIILGLGLLAQVLFLGNPVNLFSLAAIVAAIVYVVDVRPAIRSLTRN